MLNLLKNNLAFFGPYLIFLLICSISLLCFNRVDVFMFINRHHYPVADTFFRIWTNLGLGYLIIPVALGLSFVKARYVFMSLLTFLLTFAVNDSLKYIMNKPRPEFILSSLHISFYSVPGVEVYSTHSFPSGHAAIAFALFCFIALISKRNVLKFTAFIIAFLIGYSRIYLAEHFVADIFAGSIIGVSIAIVVYIWLIDSPSLGKLIWIDKPIIPLT
jgi:membrane-associated phospholipid phosphatase